MNALNNLIVLTLLVAAIVSIQATWANDYTPLYDASSTIMFRQDSL